MHKDTIDFKTRTLGQGMGPILTLGREFVDTLPLCIWGIDNINVYFKAKTTQK